MDYGQNAGMDNKPDFFTAGAGTNQENVNNFEAENNLDLSNDQVDWRRSVGQSNREIGNTAMNMPEGIGESIEISSRETPNITEMGKIVNLEMPPDTKNEYNLTSAAVAKHSLDSKIIDISEVRGKNDRITNESVIATEQKVIDFTKGKIGPKELVDDVVTAKKAYLLNTFGRKYAEGDKKAA